MPFQDSCILTIISIAIRARPFRAYPATSAFQGSLTDRHSVEHPACVAGTTTLSLHISECGGCEPATKASEASPRATS
uniref:Uncharacterized protein n=1 Tax=Oryza brachyantha TaxID=4533 RepID=J3MAN8_ORYBR